MTGKAAIVGDTSHNRESGRLGLMLAVLLSGFLMAAGVHRIPTMW